MFIYYLNLPKKIAEKCQKKLKNSYFFAFFPKFWQKMAKKVKKTMFFA